MKKMICLLLAVCVLLALSACGAKSTGAPAAEQDAAALWSRAGYYQDEGGKFLSVTWMDDVVDPGWYVGLMLGEDLIADSYGGTLKEEGATLRGALMSGGDKGELNVTLAEEGTDGVLLTVEGGESYHFAPVDLPTATIFVSINTEGQGSIAYAEGESAPEIDPEYPYQSAVINLAEPATHTFLAQASAGYRFVKWTMNGAELSAEPQISLLLDESADYVAVFEEDPDWQNPVMNFIGDYQCDRARAHVECMGNEDAWITIEWGGSAWELARWTIVGTLNTDTLTIQYSGCTKEIVVYDDQGQVKSQTPEYEGGTGTIVFHDNGTFTWHEDQSAYGEDMVFEWMQVTN